MKEYIKNNYQLFKNNISIDFQNKIVQIPEYISWIDSSFVNNINKYKDCIPKEFLNYYNIRKEKIKVVIEKYDWKLSYVNFKNCDNTI